MNQPKSPSIFQIRISATTFQQKCSERRPLVTAVMARLYDARHLHPETDGPNHVLSDPEFHHCRFFIRKHIGIFANCPERLGKPRIPTMKRFVSGKSELRCVWHLPSL